MARTKPFLIALAAAVALPAAAGADQIKFNAHDQAAARAVIIKPADLGTGWKGGRKKPDLSSITGCSNYHPKSSDLVTTGAAESEYSNSGVDFDSEAEILQTSQMVALDWQRSVKPALVTCVRQLFAKQLGGKGKLVSAKKIGFPRVATYTADYRVVFSETANGQTVPIMSDFLIFGKGRTEVTLVTVAPYVARAAVTDAESRLARAMVKRIAA